MRITAVSLKKPQKHTSAGSNSYYSAYLSTSRLSRSHLCLHRNARHNLSQHNSVSMCFRVLAALIAASLVAIAHRWLPGALSSGQYQRNIQYVKVLFFGGGAAGVEPALSAFAEAFAGRKANLVHLVVCSDNPFRVGALLPLGYALSWAP